MATYKPFTAETRMSGIITNEISVFKGAPNSMINLVKQQQGNIPLNIESSVWMYRVKVAHH